MTDACTSPGSRSTPLVLALAREPRLRAHSHIDERASGFFALGIAKASGRPVAVTCTSGTAAANLAPAVIEASEARVPLIVLTADRPPELREIGAGQTIDQIKLYGDAVRWFFEVGNHDATPQREPGCARSRAARGPRRPASARARAPQLAAARTARHRGAGRRRSPAGARRASWVAVGRARAGRTVAAQIARRAHAA